MPLPSLSGPRILLAVALGALPGCELEEPATPAGDYHAAMQPLMAQNAAVAKELQSLAADIKKEAPEAEAVADRLQSKVLPEVKALAEGASAVSSTDPAISSAHEGLVDAWEARADVLEDTLSAWKEGDAEAARGAADGRYSAARAEARYFDAINEILVPQGYVLQPYGG